MRRPGSTQSAAPAWVPKALAVIAIAVSAIPIFVGPSVRVTVPYPDAPQFADSARHLAHGDGYVETVGISKERSVFFDDAPATPISPPGYAVALAPFARFGEWPGNVQFGVRFWVLVWLVVCAASAWALGGPLAGALTGIVIGSSTFATDMSRLVMSDVFGALILVAPIGLLAKATPWRSIASGVCVGLACVVRLSAVLIVPALFFAIPRGSRIKAVGAAAVFLVALAGYNWAMFDSPLETGYTRGPPGRPFFSSSYPFDSDPPFGNAQLVRFGSGYGLIEWTTPEDKVGHFDDVPAVVAYAGVVVGLPPSYYPPLFGLVGIAWFWANRRKEASRYAMVMGVATFGVYVLYYFVSLRFMAPIASALAIAGSVAIADIVKALWERRGDREELAAEELDAQ